MLQLMLMQTQRAVGFGIIIEVGNTVQRKRNRQQH